MNKEILVSVENVSRYYGDHCAVNNISFKVYRGEILGMLGTNGSGKSTTMQMICGVLSVSTGQITIINHDISVSPIAAKKHIGFLPEKPPLYEDMNVDEYLRYAARLRGVDKKMITGAIQQSKQRCGLADVGKRLLGNLSKGFQQRVGIAQAIIHDPDIIIFDEPSVGLDPNQIAETRRLISELGRQHSVILSSHILAEIQGLCDRVMIINQGQLVLDEYMDKLHQDTGDTLLKIALKKPPSLQVLSEIEGVSDVQKIGAQHFQLCCHQGMQTIDKITELAVASQWGIYEMTPISQPLEDIFLRLTHKETQTVADQDMEKST